MKILLKIMCEQFKRSIQIGDCQLGFMTRKSTGDAIFMMRYLQEKYKTKENSLYHSEKASERSIYMEITKTNYQRGL